MAKIEKPKEALIKEIPKTVNKDMVSVIFRENRKYDLHIGRDMVTFMARELKKIPKSWLRHKDWDNVAKYFIVKGV